MADIVADDAEQPEVSNRTLGGVFRLLVELGEAA